MRTSWFSVVMVLACGAVAAQELEPAPVLVANTFERQNTTVKIAGFGVGGTSVDMNRVTVVLDGWDVTGEFQSKTIKSPRATELKVGSEIPAAIDHNRLLLQWPDGTVVTAKIVQREKHQVPRDRQARD